MFPWLARDQLLTRHTIDIWPRKLDICHELTTCNWVTTGREADAVASVYTANRTRFVHVGSVVSSVNATPTRSRPDAYGSLESGREPHSVWTQPKNQSLKTISKQ